MTKSTHNQASKQSKSKPRRNQPKKVKKGSKKRYKIRNWPEYNEMLKQRGAIEVWVDESVLEDWYAKPTLKQGAQRVYTDRAIILTLQFGKVFNQRLRQTEGLVASVFGLMGIDLSIPHYSTLSRRSESVCVKKLPKETRERVVVVVDSSGLKVYGEGEWKVRKHGWSKHRTWRKIHLMITPRGEIRAAELTENNVSDDEAAAGLLEQEEAEIEAFAGDGAYDTRKVYDVCDKLNVNRVLIPPQKNAKIWKHGNCRGAPHKRDENLRQIRASSRKQWKEAVGYHVRSLAETAMFRLKTIFGDKLHARNFNRQVTEAMVTVSALNKMTHLGMPNSYAVR
jgi:hypothetical protein